MGWPSEAGNRCSRGVSQQGGGVICLRTRSQPVLILTPTGCHPEVVARLASWVPCPHTPHWCRAGRSTGLSGRPSVFQWSCTHVLPYGTFCDNVDNRLPCTVRLQPHRSVLGGQSQGRDKRQGLAGTLERGPLTGSRTRDKKTQSGPRSSNLCPRR